MTSLDDEEENDVKSKGGSKTCKTITGVIAALLLIGATSAILWFVVFKPAPPTVPGAPIYLTRNDALTGTTVVAFSWDAPNDDGGEVVIDYEV